MTKTLVISSYGLKNIVLDKRQEEDFSFIFGEEKFQMKSIFAEFISPNVSRIHQTDPTNNEYIISTNDNDDNFNKLLNSILTSNIISLLLQISCGNSIEITEDQAIKIRFLSIILGNEEIHDKIDELFPINISEQNINLYLKYIECYYHHSQFKAHFNNLCSFIASHFYLLDNEVFFNLPQKIQYTIISHPNLKIESEDDLFDVISKIIKFDQNTEISKNMFLEQININGLSESKFQYFISEIDIDEMSSILWQNICQKFFPHADPKMKSTRIIKRCVNNYEYDGNESNALNGIIKNLSSKIDGNISDKGCVIATSSSVYGEYWYARNAVDFDSFDYFCSCNEKNTWIKYDFVDKKVHPTYYSIRSEPNGPGFSHLESWVVEGSNTNRDDDWKILDSRNNVTSLNNYMVICTFKIQKKLEEKEYFRYLRIRQTGLNAQGIDIMTMSALEYFGNLMLPYSK